MRRFHTDINGVTREVAGEPERYAKDASGHEHDQGGLFTGPGSGKGAESKTNAPASHTPDSVQKFADDAIGSMRALHQAHEKKHGFNKGHNKQLSDHVHERMAELERMAGSTKHKGTLKAIGDAKARLGAFVRALV